ncbi:MAG: STAS domain-containing protein [Magnetococcales bacterium]|nr:STAS domain-containing protein [Magnetococcales bacterium]
MLALGKSMRVIENEQEISITLPKEFSYETHQSFRSTYISKSKEKSYVVDFSHVTSLDSTALGALLILQEHARSKVILRGANEDVVKVLTMASFDEIFTIEP